MHGLPYTPEVPGTYNIIASFEGSAAYGSSSSSTYLTVSEQSSSTAPASTTAPQSLADLYFVPAIIGIIVAIVLVGAANVLLLRKRP
jgi:hypothetical protein